MSYSYGSGAFGGQATTASSLVVPKKGQCSAHMHSYQVPLQTTVTFKTDTLINTYGLISPTTSTLKIDTLINTYGLVGTQADCWLGSSDEIDLSDPSSCLYALRNDMESGSQDALADSYFV
ncbi:hypothetical protein TorRG33x02_013430 [Trema orientale]|uniref:Uncharacterized protein n=1 Tax=Trema orientale TaxID=63057 RepID=A0A2P5FZS8_TREOI|nr:hypothetical protein TorRG33x02_013430 [Trema orientale]